jgi:hypothetical protein
MEKYFIHSGIIAFIYLLLKFTEMRIVTKENKPIKEMMRDTIIVYLSGILGLYIIDELMPVAASALTKVNVPSVFIDAPGF